MHSNVYVDGPSNHCPHPIKIISKEKKIIIIVCCQLTSSLNSSGKGWVSYDHVLLGLSRPWAKSDTCCFQATSYRVTERTPNIQKEFIPTRQVAWVYVQLFRSWKTFHLATYSCSHATAVVSFVSPPVPPPPIENVFFPPAKYILKFN